MLNHKALNYDGFNHKALPHVSTFFNRFLKIVKQVIPEETSKPVYFLSNTNVWATISVSFPALKVLGERIPWVGISTSFNHRSRPTFYIGAMDKVWNYKNWLNNSLTTGCCFAAMADNHILKDEAYPLEETGIINFLRRRFENKAIGITRVLNSMNVPNRYNIPQIVNAVMEQRVPHTGVHLISGSRLASFMRHYANIKEMTCLDMCETFWKCSQKNTPVDFLCQQYLFLRNNFIDANRI